MIVLRGRRYWEGSNGFAGGAALLTFAVCLVKYDFISRRIAPLGIDPDVLLSYCLNLYAIGLGALVSLFALLASRPTEFLNRIRSTATFARLIANIKITMLFCSFVILGNFILGVLKISPSESLSIHTSVFVFWCALAAATAVFYVRTVGLIFKALT